MAISSKRLVPPLNRTVTGMSVTALWLFIASLLLGSTTAIVSSDQGYTAQLDQSLVASHTGSSRIRSTATPNDTDQPGDLDPPAWLILAAAELIVCSQITDLPAASDSKQETRTAAFDWPQLRAPPLV